MSSPSSPAVATWYSSGWKVWKLLLSTMVTSTGARRSARAAARPPNPAPTITTRWRLTAQSRPTTLTTSTVTMPELRRGGAARSGRQPPVDLGQPRGAQRGVGPAERLAAEEPVVRAQRRRVGGLDDDVPGAVR